MTSSCLWLDRAIQISQIFYHAMIVLGCIFAAGVIATFIYTRMMVFIGQGVLKNVSETICLNICRHYQSVIFDQNTNGSIMSLYTNDTDTLRQMISQAIPQALMSFFHYRRNIYLHARAKPASYRSCSTHHRGF